MLNIVVRQQPRPQVLKKWMDSKVLQVGRDAAAVQGPEGLEMLCQTCSTTQQCSHKQMAHAALAWPLDLRHGCLCHERTEGDL